LVPEHGIGVKSGTSGTKNPTKMVPAHGKSGTSGTKTNSRIRKERRLWQRQALKTIRQKTALSVTESTGSNHQYPEKADSAGWCGTNAS
jgi:hypothetical protein